MSKKKKNKIILHE